MSQKGGIISIKKQYNTNKSYQITNELVRVKVPPYLWEDVEPVSHTWSGVVSQRLQASHSYRSVTVRYIRRTQHDYRHFIAYELFILETIIEHITLTTLFNGPLMYWVLECDWPIVNNWYLQNTKSVNTVIS